MADNRGDTMNNRGCTRGGTWGGTRGSTRGSTRSDTRGVGVFWCGLAFLKHALNQGHRSFYKMFTEI